MTDMGHVGLFYEGDADLWRQLAALLGRLGPERRWLYVADEHDAAAVLPALGAEGIDVGMGVAIAASALHLRDPEIVVDAIVAAMAARLEPGATLLIEMSWVIRSPSSSVYLREYEAAIEALASAHTALIVCLYNQEVLLDRQLLNGLQTHALICGDDGGLVPSPYFVPPALFAQRNERAQFHYWLSQLRARGALSAPGPVPASGQLQPIYHVESPTPPVAAGGEQGRWQITSFGRLRVYRTNGEPVQWAVPGGATYKTKTLFAFLLFRGAEGASAMELADLLWPEATGMQQSLNRLYHTVGCLRQALSPERAAGRDSPFVLRRDERYYLALPPDTWIDLPAFQEHCYRGNLNQQNQQLQQSLQCYQSAKHLYSGDLLADLPAKYTDHAENDWCWSRRYWFRNMYVKVLREMAEIYRHLENIPAALAVCDEGLQLEPCADMLHQEKMRVLHAARRRDALQRQYRLYCKALVRFDLGEPTEATTQLYQSLLASVV